jgi:hypothetical protein
VRALERGAERIKGGVRDIDARVGKLSQTATRIGDRLQRADGCRVRALEAQELIAYLQVCVWGGGGGRGRGAGRDGPEEAHETGADW